MPNIKRGMMGAAGSVGGATFELFSWGHGASGRLGHGNTTNLSSPVQVGSLKDWGTPHGDMEYGNQVNVKTDGTLWSWGLNQYGELGHGNTTSLSSPVQVGSLTTWAQADISNRIVGAITTGGALFTWGNNSYGQLGDGSTTLRSSPVQVGSLTDWETAVCNGHCMMSIKTDGTLWGWGYNTHGQIADGSTTHRSSPVQVGSATNWAGLSRRGTNGFMAVTTAGTLWTWGWGIYGGLGDGTGGNYATAEKRTNPVQIGSLTTWASVGGGGSHAGAAIKTDGTLWTWGSGGSGQLGHGNETSLSSPVQVGSLTNWETIQLGKSTNALKTDGTIWSWGPNFYGGIGDGTSGEANYKSSPVQVGSETYWTATKSARDFSMGTK